MDKYFPILLNVEQIMQKIFVDQTVDLQSSHYPVTLLRDLRPVQLDWAIYCTLGNHSKPLGTITLPKSPTFLGNFCAGVEIIHFSSEIFFVQLL